MASNNYKIPRLTDLAYRNLSLEAPNSLLFCYSKIFIF